MPRHLGRQAGVVDVLAGAAGALLLQRRAVVIELQRHADDVVAGLVQQRRDDGGVHAAGHGRHHARADRQADRRARGLDRRIHVGAGDGRNGADVLSEGHGGPCSAKAAQIRGPSRNDNGRPRRRERP
jgi:hypothetical protein